MAVDSFTAPRRFAGAHVLAALVGAAVAIAIATLSVSRHLLPGVFNDDGAYLALGRALASGAGYHSTYLVGAPLQVKFPPGYPVLLSVLWRVGHTPGAVQAIATTINILACGIAAGLFWWIGRERLRLPATMVATFVVLPFVLDSAVQYFTLVLSEPLFMLAMAIAFVLVDRRGDKTHANAVALGATLAIAVFLRTQGIALMAAILLGLFIDRSRRRELAVVAATSILPVAAWQTYLFTASRHETLLTQPSESSYLSFLTGGGASGVAANAMDYLHLLGSYVSNSPGVGLVIAVALVMVSTIGAFMLLRRSASLGLALLANGVMLLAWPAYQDRYLLPMLPLAGLAAGCALHAGIQRLGRTRNSQALIRWEAVAAAVALVLVGFRQYDIRRDAADARATGKVPSSSTPSFWLQGNAWFVDATARWTVRSTSRDDRIAIVSPAGLWLYTGRQTVPMEVVEPRGAPSVFDVPGRYLAGQIATEKVTVVLVEGPSGITAREVAALRSACPAALQHLDEFSGIVAWRVKPNDECLAALDKRFQPASTSSASNTPAKS